MDNNLEHFTLQGQPQHHSMVVKNVEGLPAQHLTIEIKTLDTERKKDSPEREIHGSDYRLLVAAEKARFEYELQLEELNDRVKAELNYKREVFKEELDRLFDTFFDGVLDYKSALQKIKKLYIKLEKYRERNQEIQDGDFSAAIKTHVERKLNLFEDFVKQIRFKLEFTTGINGDQLTPKRVKTRPKEALSQNYVTRMNSEKPTAPGKNYSEKPTAPQRKTNKFLSLKAVGALAAAVGVGMFAWSNLNKQNPTVTENPKNPVQATQVQVAENLPTNPIRVAQVEPTRTPKIVSESKLTKPTVPLTKTPKAAQEKPKVTPPPSIPSPANLSPQKIESVNKMVALGDITGSLTLPVTPEKKDKSVRENVVKVAPNRPLIKSIQQQRIIINTKTKNIAVIVPAETPSFSSDFPKNTKPVETDINRMDEIYNGDNNQPTPIDTKPVQSTTSFISKGVRFSIK
jgi:hypothetical protein